MSTWNDDEHDLLDGLIRQLEQAWQAGEPPDLAALVPAADHPGRHDALVALIQTDQELRWQRGQTKTVEEYLAEWPELRERPECVAEIRESEERLRSEASARRPEPAAIPDAGWPTQAHAIRIRCPHCHQPVEILDRSPAGELTCPSCGSGFQLAGDVGTPSVSGEQTCAPQAPRRIAHFELLELLGQGAFGSVWKARDTKLNRIVAIKIPRRGQLLPDDVERFLREAQASAELHHPNIVTVFEVGHDGELAYIVSEFIKGQPLDKWLESQGGRLSDREAAALCITIAQALHYAHQCGVIHRDLKPSNIMLDAAGQSHLLDFGLAKRDGGEITMTVEGQILGTPAYMSPEQARGEGHLADARSDVYSLGVILFELLTGERPFRGDVRMLLRQVVEDEAPSARKLNNRVSRDLETVCAKCLENAPRRRYASANELAAELKRFSTGHPIQARPVAKPERILRWCKREPVVAALSAAAVLLLVIVAIIATAGYVISSHALRQMVAAQQQQAETLVQALLVTSPDAVPYAIQGLEPLREHATSHLAQRFRDTALPLPQRLRAAYGLAAFGLVEQEFLAQSIPAAHADECHNLVLALSIESEAAKTALVEHAGQTGKRRDWRGKSRIAVVALHLGQAVVAQQMLALKPDPVERTEFIETFRTWHGKLLELAPKIDGVDDSAYRSGMCCALASISPGDLTLEEMEAFAKIMRDWYLDELDGGTHSAAGFALRQWNLELPSIPRSEKPEADSGWFVNSIGMTMVRVPAGEFLMGSPDSDQSAHPDEKPRHRVRITRPFYMGIHLVTQADYARVMGLAPKRDLSPPVDGNHALGNDRVVEIYINPNEKRFERNRAGYSNIPVEGVDWHDAQTFCLRLSQLPEEKALGRVYRLPTEAEWEYACRAKTTTRWSFGDDENRLGECGWFSGNSRNGNETLPRQMCPVGQKRPNAWGFYDMHGSLWEWCSDWYDESYYRTSPTDNPSGPVRETDGVLHDSCSHRVLRGGCCIDSADYCRSASRRVNCGKRPPSISYWGFRVSLAQTD